MAQLSSSSLNTIGRWIVLVILGYSLFHVTYGAHKQPQQPTEKPAVSSAETPVQSQQKPDCATEHKFPLMSMEWTPTLTPIIRTENIEQGHGEAAACGQHARITYSYALSKAKTVDINPGVKPDDATNTILASGTKEMVIGGGSEPHGVELGMIGMKTGGKRRMIVPYPMTVAISPVAAAVLHLRDAIQSHPLIAHVTLESLTPALPVSAMPLREINTDTAGFGKEAYCGDRVSADITLWKMDGTKLYATDKPVELTIGASALPYGIEMGMIGMLEGGVRLVVMPPAYEKPLVETGEKSRILPPLERKEIVLAEIRLLHIAPIKDKEKAAGDAAAEAAKPQAAPTTQEAAPEPKKPNTEPKAK